MTSAFNFLTNAAHTQTNSGMAPAVIPKLDKALTAAAPHAPQDKWLAPLTRAFTKFDMLTRHRIAGALGQFVVEAGPDLGHIMENTNYTQANRLMAIFPSEFPTLDIAEKYAGKPQAIACRAYANRLGNGNEASGDGWTYRGHGLIQLTGKSTFANFAKANGFTPEDAAVYLGSLEGAAVSGAWFFVWKGLLPALDKWDLASVTRGVNGTAMLQHEQRVQASQRALEALSS